LQKPLKYLDGLTQGVKRTFNKLCFTYVQEYLLVTRLT